MIRFTTLYFLSEPNPFDLSKLGDVSFRKGGDKVLASYQPGQSANHRDRQRSGQILPDEAQRAT